MINYQELVQDTVMGVKQELLIQSSIIKVEVKKKGYWYDFQLTTNQEFLDDDQHDNIFELVINANFDLRQKIEEKVYFKHSFVAVQKCYVEDEEFDFLPSTYEEVSKQLDDEWLGLSPY